MSAEYDIPILDQISAENRSKVYKIIQLKMSVEAKIERLENYMTVSQLRECRKWLEKKAGDFVSLLTDSDQEFVEDYFESKDISLLDAVLTNYDENTRNVYEAWKKSAGFGLKEEETEQGKEPRVEERKKKKPRKPVETESEEDSEESEVETKKKNKKTKGKAGKKKTATETEEDSEEETEESEEEEKPKKKTKNIKKHKKTK